MRRGNRAFLMRVFQTLGPSRVQRGLEATGHGWETCFFALACGQLPDEALPLPTRTLLAGPFYGAWLGIAPGWVYDAACLWDRDEAGFRDVAQEWLDASVRQQQG